MKWNSIVFLLLITFSINACKTSKQTDYRYEKIQLKLEELRKSNDLPGINFSVIYKDGQSHDFALGFADIEQNIPNTTKARLLLGSIGKTYAAAIVFQLIDEKKLALQDRLIDYFPNKEWLLRLPNIQEITVQMLLEHTSGLPRWVMKDEVWKVVQEPPNLDGKIT